MCNLSAEIGGIVRICCEEEFGFPIVTVDFYV
jgi:hypothetical protein